MKRLNEMIDIMNTIQYDLRSSHSFTWHIRPYICRICCGIVMSCKCITRHRPPALLRITFLYSKLSSGRMKIAKCILLKELQTVSSWEPYLMCSNSCICPSVDYLTAHSVQTSSDANLLKLYFIFESNCICRWPHCVSYRFAHCAVDCTVEWGPLCESRRLSKRSIRHLECTNMSSSSSSAVHTSIILSSTP